jgi:uncharacterized protein (DUF2141 family)
MECRTICWFAVLTGTMLLGTACSSNNSKVAENSAVESRGDGKGTAPSSAAAKQADRAMVRFINGTSQEKDVAFGDMTAFDGVGDRDITAYKELPAERREFKLMTHGGGKEVLATDSEGLSAGKHYTLLAVTDKQGKATLHNIDDDLTPPDAGKAKVRVINLARGVSKVDLYGKGGKDSIISGAALNSPTDYKTVDPAETELSVRNGTSKKNSVPIKDIDLKSGKLYTILVFQDKKGSLKTKTVEDVFSAAPNGVSKANS